VPSISSSPSEVPGFGRQAITTGAVCGAFVTLTLLSFAAALIDRLRGAAPPDNLVE